MCNMNFESNQEKNDIFNLFTSNRFIEQALKYTSIVI